MTKDFNALKNADPEEVWGDIYRAASPATTGRPGMALKRFVESLSPGRALELACGKGDDAVWLAQKPTTSCAPLQRWMRT